MENTCLEHQHSDAASASVHNSHKSKHNDRMHGAWLSTANSVPDITNKAQKTCAWNTTQWHSFRLQYSAQLSTQFTQDKTQWLHKNATEDENATFIHDTSSAKFKFNVQLRYDKIQCWLSMVKLVKHTTKLCSHSCWLVNWSNQKTNKKDNSKSICHNSGTCWFSKQTVVTGMLD